MHYKFIKIATKIIESYYSHTHGRHNKEPIEHYLKTIFKVLKTGMQWSELQTPLHYTTYNKKHIKWSNDGIYKSAFDIAVKCCKLKRNEIKDLFIDSTMIKNKRGRDCIGPNIYDRYKSATKINAIVTNTGIPLSICCLKASVHDSTLTDSAINDIKIKVVGTRIIGDKGYISSNQKTILKKKKIQLITPLRSNQLRQLSEFEKLKLSNRHIVENFFSWLKNYRKIQTRTCNFKSSFNGFVYISCIDILLNKRSISMIDINKEILQQ